MTSDLGWRVTKIRRLSDGYFQASARYYEAPMSSYDGRELPAYGRYGYGATEQDARKAVISACKTDTDFPLIFDRTEQEYLVILRVDGIIVTEVLFADCKDRAEAEALSRHDSETALLYMSMPTGRTIPALS